MKVGYLLFGSSQYLDHVGIVDSFQISTKRALELAGANLGNLAFKYAAKKLFCDEHEVIFITYGSDVEFVRKNIDILVLPEANLINPNVDYSGPAKFIASVDKPCILLGVGAQAKDVSSEVTYSAGTESYMREVSKRTSNIFVRGEFTKDVINRMGIDNVCAIGCPSFMINNSRHLWNKVKNNLNKLNYLDNFVVTEGVYPLKNRNEHIDRVERRLFDFVLSDNADYVGQVQTSVISNGLRNYSDMDRDDMYYLRSYLAPACGEERFNSIAIKRFKAFLRADEWMNYCRSRQSVVGSRIHGNFLAIQAETPALPLTHDSRTEELCKIMKIPHISIEEARNIRTSGDLLDAYDVLRSVNSIELDEHRSNIASQYVDNIVELGITPSKSLLHIANLT